MSALDRLRKAVARRAIFPSVALVFLGLDATYDPGGDSVALSPSFESNHRGRHTVEDVPLALVSSSGWDGGPVRPAFVMATLGYDHADRWASGPNRERGQEYAALKKKTTRIIIDRLAKRLPEGFQDAIRFSVAATPLTLERYTGNTRGSFMGFHCRAGEYGQFFPQTSAIDGLSFAGQWVFRPTLRSHAPANWYGRTASAEPALPGVPKDREIDALCRRRAWARLLAKVHELDVMACPRCGSRMSVIAVITEPAQIRRIIACLDRHGRGPPPLQ